MRAWRAYVSALPEFGEHDGAITPAMVGDSLLARFLALAARIPAGAAAQEAPSSWRTLAAELLVDAAALHAAASSELQQRAEEAEALRAEAREASALRARVAALEYDADH